uniref:Kinetochore protein Spc24 n=1 Tax=Sinocyclocheilus grahami TaxID=75366 RepID=A0A672MET2_SINGR
ELIFLQNNPPSAARSQYVAQLYFKVTQVKLEVDTEPHILRGVHYGTDVATPFNIDPSTRSACEISNDLWSLVNTEW